MKKISRLRFEALAAYCRHPTTLYDAEEVFWYETADGQIVATIIRDRCDNDYSGIILARDETERFRFINCTIFVDSVEYACDLLRQKIYEILPNLDEERRQNDTKKPPVDFFSPVKTKQARHPSFEHLTSNEAYSPAREIIVPMMRWYEDPDKNFIEQFQTTGFDARLWELYLFAMLTENGYAMNRDKAFPDFNCWGMKGELCVEATTVNSSERLPPPPMETLEELKQAHLHYYPIKYGSALFSKLNKKYWEYDHVKDKPFVIAIQDFNTPISMTISRNGLSSYLYGYDYRTHHDESGKLFITPIPINEHCWGEKKIPSTFFKLDGAENISAIIFNSSATISKFNRIGLMAGFGSKKVKMIRSGAAVNFNKNSSKAKPYVMNVNNHNYTESWIEGMDVFHNPWAKNPLPAEMLIGAAHHYLQPDGQIYTINPDWHPFSSITHISV
jgi:hypothetical protein